MNTEKTPGTAASPRRWTRLLLRAADELFAGPNPDSDSLDAWTRMHRCGALSSLDLLVRPARPDGPAPEPAPWVVTRGLRAGFVVNPVAIGDDQGNLVCAWESPADQAIRLALRRGGQTIGPIRADSGRPAVGRRNPRLTLSVGGGFILRWDQGSDRRYARLFSAEGRPLSEEVRLSARRGRAGHAA